MRCLERGSIVGAVAGHGDDVSSRSQYPHDPELLPWIDAREDVTLVVAGRYGTTTEAFAMGLGALVQGTVGFGQSLVAAPLLLLIDTRLVPGPLTVAEVASYMGVSAHVVTSMLRAGAMPGIKFGREWRVARVDLESYVNEARRKLL